MTQGLMDGILVFLFVAIVPLILFLATSKLLKKFHKKKKYSMDFIELFFLTLLTVILLTYIINFVVYRKEFITSKTFFPIPTGNLDVWVGYFGSIVGSFVSAVITIFVLNRTIKGQHENTVELIEAERDRTREMLESQHMPITEIEVFDFNGIIYKVKIENISNSTLLDGKLFLYKSNKKMADGKFGNLKSGSSTNVQLLSLTEFDEKHKLVFRIEYKDILGNTYYQTAEAIRVGEINIIIGLLSVPIKLIGLENQ